MTRWLYPDEVIYSGMARWWSTLGRPTLRNFHKWALGSEGARVGVGLPTHLGQLAIHLNELSLVENRSSTGPAPHYPCYPRTVTTRWGR